MSFANNWTRRAAIGGVAAVYNRYSYFDEMVVAFEHHDEFLRSFTN